MLSKTTHPKWWLLYLTFPLLIGLFVLDARLKISSRGHQAVQVGIILFVYGLIHLWLKANRSALSRLDQNEHGRSFRVIRIPPTELPESVHERRSILQLSDSEIHGLLSNGMDMSYLDAESFSMAEPQELNKKE
jgi:hypothetical protein